MKKTKVSFSTVLTGFLASLLLFFSCEVGLGEAVDTRPPSIVIEKPEVDKVIRDKFLISGTWEDDGTIDNVYVLLKRTDGNALDGTSLERKIDATFTINEEDNEKGNWQAIVDPLEENNQIIDGSYQATVVITDKGKHSTSQITTFTIDNTAPVLILSKPNSTPEDQTLSAYGQRLFLEGSIADATKDTWVQLDFYSGEECTEEEYLTTIETGMISPTDVNSNNARLAIYNADLTQQYATEYYNLYGKIEKAGAEQVYAKITVYDTAETCPVEGESNNLTESGKIKGNASQSFYLTKKLAESITKSQTANGYGLAPIDIYNVLNDTYALKNQARAADAKTIKEELCSDEQRKSITVFTINPENSPYFTISGLKTLNKDGKDFEEGNTIVNGTQTLEVSVFMGSDSIALKDDDDFYVYLLECDKYGKPIKEDLEANRIKLYSKYKESGSGSEKKTYYKIGGKTDHKTTSGAYVFSIPMNKSLRADPDKGAEGYVNMNLEYGKNYIILVSGKDTEGNTIETTDGGYGFCFSAGGSAPRLTITEPADNTVFIKKGDGLTVKGTVVSESGEPRLTLSNEANRVDLPLTPAATGEGTFTFEKQISPQELGFAQNESVIYSLIFSATRDATETTQTKSVWYDVEGPAITMADPVPLVKTNTIKADGSSVTKDSVNGVISLSGSIIDAFDSRFGTATYKVEQNGVQVDKPGLSGSLTKNFDFTLDTKLLADNKDAVIVITATDYSGNVNETRYTYFVDQSTDVPRISNSESGKDITKGVAAEGLNYVKAGHNLFVRSGNLVLSVSDDDDVAATTVTVQKYDDSTGTLYAPVEAQNKTYTATSVITHTLPSEVAIYQVEVAATDTSSPANTNTMKFFIRVTGTGPDVTVKSNKEYVKTGGEYVVTLSMVDEGNKPYTIKINDDDNTAVQLAADKDDFEYRFTPVKNDDGTVDSVKFTVIDKNSSFTEKIFNPKFDDTVPAVSITGKPESMTQTEDATFLFKGSASDEAGAGIAASGVEKVEIMFSDTANASLKTDWIECNGTEKWNYEASWASDALKDVFATETSKTVTVKATDGAGNEKTTSAAFVYDKMAPKVSITNVPATVKGNTNIQAAIEVKDTNIDHVEVTVNKGETQVGEKITVRSFTGEGETKTASVTIPGSSLTQDGDYTIKAKGVDKNNRESSVENKTFTVDTQAPVVDNLKLLEVTGGSEKQAYLADGIYYVNNTVSGKTFKISGIATDTIGVDSVELLITKNGSTSTTKTATRKGTLGQWYFDGIDLSDWDGAGASARVIVKDKAGNETAASQTTLNIKFDVTPPATVHKIDDSLKNLEFRIGDYANDKGEADVGGKYSDGTYGSALTMLIRGNFPDETGGSGINKFYYKTFNNQEVKIDASKENAATADGKIFFKTLDDLKAYVIANKTGDFSPLTSVETKNVEYNVGPYTAGSWVTVPAASIRFGGSAATTANASGQYQANSKGYVQFRTSVDSNFKTTIKGFQEGKNYLVIVAEDNAGNAAVDSAKVNGVEYPCYSLNVDITAPAIPSKPEGTKYTNLEETGGVVISGTVSDKPNAANGSSELKKIVFTRDGSSGSIEVKSFTAPTDADKTAAGTDYASDSTLKHWEVDISSLLPENGTANISAKVTDNAGYEFSTLVATVVVDKTAPVIDITSHANGDASAPTLTVKGTAGDGTGAGIDTDSETGFVLYYTKSDTVGVNKPTTATIGTDAADISSKWVKYARPSLSGQNWSQTVNTADFTTAGGNTPVYFALGAKDKSGTGNQSYTDPVKVIIDRKAPVSSALTIDETAGSELSASTTKWFSNTTLSLSGSFTDAGGSGVKAVKYAVLKADESTYEAEKTITSDGSYTENVKGFETGTNRIKVWAVDVAGNSSVPVEYVVKVDVTAPELTESGIGTTGKTTKDGFTLTGKAWDTNQLDRIEIKCGNTVWKSTDTNSIISLSKATAAPANTNWSATFTTDLVGDGTKEFTITAYDVAQQTKQLTRTVVVDTQKPVIGNVSVDATGGVTIGTGTNAVIWYKTTSVPVTVPVSDQGDSGVSKVEYATQTGSNVTWTPLSSDGTNYVGTVNFAGNGAQTLRLKATDVAKNESEEKTVSVNIDTSAPELTALYYKKGTEAVKELDNTVYLKTGTQIIVYGNYNDEQSGVENLTFKVGGTAVSPTVTYSTTAITSSAPSDSSYTIASSAIAGKETTIKSWKAVITPQTSGRFTVTGTNRTNNPTSETTVFDLAVDGTAPTVTIENPSADINWAQSLTEKTYTFKVSLSDGSGTGTSKIYYAFTDSNASPSSWIEETASDGDKFIPKTFDNEGEFYFHVKAQDKAENVSDVTSRKISIDTAAPVLEITNTLDESHTNVLSDEVTASGYTISGTLTDTNKLATSDALVVKVDGVTKLTKTAADFNSNSNWSVTIAKGNASGTIKDDNSVEVEIIAKDITGKESHVVTKQFMLYYDTKAPELTVSAPAENEPVEQDEKAIKGTVSDNGYGIEKIEYTLKKGNAVITSSSEYPVTIKGEQWYIDQTVNGGKIPLGDTEGSLTLIVTAHEKKNGSHGGRTTEQSIDFYYDTANPTLTEANIGATGKTKNQGFTLSGLATDSNALASVEISWGTNNKITLTPGTGEEKSMNWSQAFVVGSASGTNHVDDGTNEFTIIAKDISGKEKQLTRTVIVDTVSPTCGTPAITSSKNTVDGKDWYKSSFIDISLEDVEDEGTGISKVEYSTDNTNWYSMSGSDTTYTATVNCANQGSNTIKVRVTDVAGNQTDAGTLTAYVDTKEPSLENSYAKYLTADYAAVSELLINGDNGYELKISAKDIEGGTGANAGKNSGIASVQYSYGSFLIDGEQSGNDWIITVPKTGNGTNNYSSTGSNKIYVIIKDNAGNEIKERVLTVTKDTTDPTVEIKSFTKAGTQTNSLFDVNGTITISGLADDTNKFGSVKLEYQKDGTSTWTTIPTTSQTSWSTTLDTTGLTDKKKYTIKATATDAAGNTKEATQAIYVNQDSDRPVITVTNMTLAAANETSYLKRTSRLEGTVSDDDGNVTKLEYSKNGTSWTEATLEYGTAWSIADLPEGDNKLYFRVTDSANATPFVTAVESETATSEAANQPKIKDNNSNYVTQTQGSLALKFMVVTKQPDVDEKKYQVFNSVANNGTGAWEDRDSLGTLGGIYTKFKISLKAKAEASISKVQAKYATDTYDINFTCDDTDHSGNGYHSWRTGEIALVDGKTEVKLKISDASSTTDPMTLEQTVTYAVDNTPPTIKIKEPSSTAGVKETMQFDLSELATTYYAVTKNDVTTAPTDADKWTLIQDTNNGLVRYVFFDDDLNETDHTDRFALYLTEATTEKPNRLGITTVAAIESTTSPYETITKVKFWVKAIDNCGNIATKDQLVNVDPQGNRPTVTLGYPVNVLKDGSYVAPTLGGTIRLDGNVTDDIAAKYVWIKIERGGNAFSAADVKFLKEKNYTIGNMTTNEVLADATITALANNADVSNYAIRVPVTGTSWNLSINGNQEFNVENAEAHLKFKIYATDADPDKVDPTETHIHRSAEITQQIVIDSRNPYISASDLKLVKYGDNSANQEYKEGTSVHGIWYLQGTIKDDDSGLRTISYKKNSDAEYTDVITSAGVEETNIGGDSHFFFTKVAHTDDTSKFDYNFSVPLGNATSGQVGTDSITLKAVEATGQNLQVEQTYSVTYDNKAPVFNTDTSNAFVKLSQDVFNSNGFYTFGAIASEDKVTVNGTDVTQSGVERIAFYFTRDLNYSLSELPDGSSYNEHTNEKDSKTNDLFDVMIYHSNGDTADVTSGNMIVNYMGKAEGDSATLSYSEGLYWRSHSGSANGKTFTYTGTTDPNIHAGGLVKINGVIYTIESVSGQTINLSSNIGEATTAAFALCNVIDNGGEKNGSATSNTHGYGFGYYGSRSTDDGDLITETFNNQGTDWIFDASINSRNLPDGPITLHMVAFDKAGNVTAPHTTTGTVKNNAPRIAGLILGTDENGNGTVDDGEFVNAWHNKFEKGYDTTGNEMHTATFPVTPSGQTQKALLTVKGLTVVKPEIIGGNGAISYSYQVGTKDSVEGGALAKDGGGSVSGTTDDVVTGAITLPVSAFIGTTNGEDSGAIPDGELSEFKFTFGDSTPGTSKTDTAGKNSSIMKVFLNVSLRETNKAKNWILPFYWKSATDNSLFGQSKDNGHIELAKDWVTTTSFTGTSGEYDADPKVSGKIKLEGIARDDTLLREIKVKFGKSMGGLGTTDTTIATYNAAGGSWTVTALENDGSINTTSGWASAVQQATYQDLKDVGIIDEIPDDKEPTSKVPYTSQDYGHVVHWILYLDTEKVTGVANTDVTVTATATDRGTPKWSTTAAAAVYTANEAEVTKGKDETTLKNSGTVTNTDGTVTEGKLTGQYQIDVVPYITKLYTGISDSAGEEFARSATGKYIIRENETVKMYGFNLAVANNAVKIGNTNITPTAGNTDANGSYINMPVGTTAVSGSLTITVNSIECLNNKNANPVFTSSTNDTITDVEYNSCANNKTNKRLTDDVELLIWNMGYFLNATNITSPMMRMDSASNYYMSYGYGIQNMYVNKNGETRSVDFSYNKFHNTNVTFDANGRIHAVAMNTDRIRDDSSRFILYTPSGTNTFPTEVASGSTSYVFSSDTKRHLELAYNGGTGIYNINRVKDSKLATYTDGTTTYIAMAYYDDNNSISPVKFRFGKNEEGVISYTEAGKSLTFTYSNSIRSYNRNSTQYNTVRGWIISSDEATDYAEGTKYIKIGEIYYAISSTAYYSSARITTQDKYYYTITGYNTTNNSITSDIYTDTSIPAEITGGIYGQIGNGVTASSQTPSIEMSESNNPTKTDSSTPGYHIVASSSSTSSFKGGPYAAVGIVPQKDNNNVLTGFIGVVAWYDASAKRVCYSWNANPDSAVVEGAWQANAQYLDEVYTGWYVDLNVDDAGGIHIAYYNSAKGDLKYVYLSSYDATPTTPVTIDSYLSVGTDLTIETRLENGKYVPYIYYFNASSNKTPNSIKVAWRKDMTTLRDGAINDLFTGAWECMTIPAENIPVEATVCGGIPTSGTYGNSVVLGYMSDSGYERAYIKGSIN